MTEQTKPCACGKRMILCSTGHMLATYPARFPQQWWCGGCGATEAGPTLVEKTVEQVMMERWRAAQQPVVNLRELTGEQVRQAAAKANITDVENHECAICGEMVWYVVEGGHLYLDSSCGCAQSMPREMPWDDAAEWIKMQDNETNARQIAMRFGIELAANQEPPR